jgi:F-type H+-transporting ATPase subunit b
MILLAIQPPAADAGTVERIATTFGVNGPHLIAQTISFGLVCALLYVLAYKPILQMLETRRKLIASGLANAEKIKAELAQIDIQRQEVLATANADGQRLIEGARAAAARLQAEETARAIAASEQILQRARDATARERAMMHAELRRDVGRLVVQATANVTGKILTAEDHQRLAEETARQLASDRTTSPSMAASAPMSASGRP